jgi:hypothetical protein
VSDPIGGAHGNWGPYSDTILRIACGTRTIEVDLATGPDASTLDWLAEAIAERFAIVTAFNPCFLARGTATAEENASAHARLAEALRGLGVRFIEADGVARADPQHVESGFAIACGVEVARELAVRFGQDAFFWFDGREFWIEPATVAGAGAVRVSDARG